MVKVLDSVICLLSSCLPIVLLDFVCGVLVCSAFMYPDGCIIFGFVTFLSISVSLYCSLLCILTNQSMSSFSFLSVGFIILFEVVFSRFWGWSYMSFGSGYFAFGLHHSDLVASSVVVF